MSNSKNLPVTGERLTSEAVDPRVQSGTTHVIAGNDAIAHAMRQINPDVVAAYPITPSSHIVEVFSEFVANGKVETEFVACESEHSAMSACVGAAASGVRAMTASASQGIALMHEVLFNAAGLRLPIVLFCGNRALSAPLSIHGDHSDAMAQRDTGWIQLYASNPQEAYDLAVQSFPIAESLDVRTPVMICFDAFDVTHMLTNVAMLDDATVRDFIGEPVLVNPLLDFDKPVSHGTYTNPNFYFEVRRSQHEGIENARNTIIDVGQKFTTLVHEKIDETHRRVSDHPTTRDYMKHFESYQLDDAETAIVILGSFAGIVREAVDQMRANGEKVGMLRLRTFRPFPASELVAALKHVRHIAVMDRTMPSGAVGGPVFNELNSALMTAHRTERFETVPYTANFIYGIGQRDFFPSHAIEIVHAMRSGNVETVNFVNIRD